MKRFFVLIVSAFVLFSSCASNARFKGSGDLCGLIIDENNSPVKDFIVHCKAAGKNPLLSAASGQSVITNESGLFVFYDLPSGEYLLSGEKKNYLRLSETAYCFNDRSKIICLQTKGYKAALLSAEELFKLGQKSSAEKLLKEICCDEDSQEKFYISAFLLLINEDEKDKKELLAELKADPEKSNLFMKNYIAEMEELLNE